MKVLSLLFTIVVVVIAALLFCESSAVSAVSTKKSSSKTNSVQPPLLPVHYISPFIEWTTSNSTPPPYINGIPYAPSSPNTPGSVYFSTQGLTYYDWETPNFPSMIEYRYGNCIDIFPGWSNKGWSCTFHNTGGQTYLISYNQSNLPPCCVFGDPWSPPPPNFLRVDVNATVASLSSEWENREPTNFATWFIVAEIPPPTGPFFYAFTQERHEPSVVLPEVEVFDSFTFPGISGFAVQNFYNQRIEKPPADAWRLPAECTTARVPNCGFFGVDEKKYTQRHNYLKKTINNKRQP